MAFTPRPAKELIAEYKLAIEGQVMRKRVALSDGTNPARALTEAKSLRDTAAKLIAQAEALEFRTQGTRWKDEIDDADARILELRQKIAYQENLDEIEKVKAMIEALQLGETITTA